MRVLITGHRGFIGRHLWRACVERGYTVTGIDIAPNGDKPTGGLEFTHLDCRGYFGHGWGRDCDLVFHCAATVGGRATIDSDPLAVATNLSLDAELFNWALRARPGRIVYFSSSAAYPVDLQNDWATCRDLTERDIRAGAANIGRPDATYGWAKLTGEMLADLVNHLGVPVHVFRPFSGYGTDQSLDYPFPSFVDRARRRADPFEIWGDGRQVRDWIHVDDLVGAVFAAIEQDVRGPVNLCTGRGVSFAELAELVAAAAAYRPEFKYLKSAPTGVRHRVGDPTAMRAFYTPKISLEEGILRAVDGQP